jgi:hypothetical protein
LVGDDQHAQLAGPGVALQRRFLRARRPAPGRGPSCFAMTFMVIAMMPVLSLSR